MNHVQIQSDPSSRTLRSSALNKMSDNNSVSSNSSDNTKDEATTPKTLLSLPGELVYMVANRVDKRGLLAVRATCRELRDASALAFCKSYLGPVKISGTSDSVQGLAIVLTSPNLPLAQQTVDRLWIRTPVEKQDPEKNHEPNKEDVARLLAAMPNLEAMRFGQDFGVDTIGQESKSAPVFLSSMANLPAQATHLCRLDLIAISLPGNQLDDMPESHRHSLHTVNFELVTLSDQNAWPRILAALHAADLKGKEQHPTMPKHLLQDFPTDHRGRG